jgi:hypothetical protein
VPEVTCAEFEMWSQVCPGAMSAANFYPGPLEEERAWWLGIGHAGGADDRNVEWAQSYHLFNPGETAAQVTLSFFAGADEAIRHQLTVAPRGVAAIDAATVPGIPVERPFAVLAESDQPICAQLFGRTFSRGLAHTRGMYSCTGVPMRLRG